MARRASSRQRGAAHLQERGGGGRELTLSAAREVKTECEARRRRGWARRRSSHRRIRRGAAPRRRARPSRCCRRRSRDEGEPQEPSVEQARESSDEWSRDQPPVGGHRGRGQARDGVDPVPLISLVGWVCSSGAQKEGKNSTTVWSVYSFDAPSSTALKSWLVVARGASAPLRLVGHLGWVHRQEARAVGRPRERMMPLREALTPRRDRAGLARKTRSARGGPNKIHHISPPRPPFSAPPTALWPLRRCSRSVSRLNTPGVSFLPWPVVLRSRRPPMRSRGFPTGRASC